MSAFSFSGFPFFASDARLSGLEPPELREDEFELPRPNPEALVVDAARLTLALAEQREDDQHGLLRIRVLHSLVAQEIEFLGTSGDAIPGWLLAALDETEWAVEKTPTTAQAA